MAEHPHRDNPTARGRSGLAWLAIISLLAGAIAGLVGAAFRYALLRADAMRESMIAWSHDHGVAGLLAVVAIASAATAMAAWLVRRLAPQASGSGIPHVEAVLNHEMPPAPLRLVAVKFVGGWLAIGAGLALGREGPSVQMGATLSHHVGRFFKREPKDCLTLLAAGAGAGLATAFNAPMAGAIFVLEELVKRFDTRITIATFGASAGAIAVSRFLLGSSSDFTIGDFDFPGPGIFACSLLLGAAAGLLGVIYNVAIMRTLHVVDHAKRVSPIALAAGIGALVGLLGWWSPRWIGGGDALTQHALTHTHTMAVLAMLLVFRFALGTVSYAASTPGGLFAPLLVLGAVSGLQFGQVIHTIDPQIMPQPTAMAVVGMAAFFTAVVRAPLTGVVLVAEMTGTSTLVLPMVFACFTAMAVPSLLRNEPIYDSLKDRMLRARRH